MVWVGAVFGAAMVLVASDNCLAQTANDAAAGERLFNNYCAVCHQPSGQGDGADYPPLAGSQWVAGTEDRLIRIVLQGLTGPILVVGTEYDSAMAGLGTALDDAQIAAVLTYIRGAWGNTANPVEPEDVAEIRDATAERTTPWTAQELLAVPPSDP